MLARENRLRSAEDFRSTMRLGQKASTDHLVLYLLKGDASTDPRFGFVVGKTVGNSVKRNLVKRRARAICSGRINEFGQDESLVIRALPGAAELTWEKMLDEFNLGLSKLKRIPA
ncbi:MAG: ribonuclease P protein component [Rhodoluna sp.]